MRPLELTIQGFKSYREKCTFNFEGRGLFGIVGPTGAGKSSILDALIYCLYGKTPRLEKETKKLINSEEDEAKLQLSFEMDAVAWEVTRVVRRKGQSQVVLKRLDDAAEPVTGDRNVNEKLPQVLGLDFGAFCASVCLSQGRFDRFLTATSSERVQILKGVFALDKVDALREAAKGHSRFLHDQIRVIQGTLEALPSGIEAGIEASQEALASARDRVGEIRKVMPAVKAAEDELNRSAEQERLLQDERQAVEATLSLIPHPDVVEDLVGREERASATVAEAGEVLASAEAALERAQLELSAIEGGGKGRDWCFRLEGLILAGEVLAEEQRAHTKAVDAAGGAVRRSETALGEAETALRSAEISFNNAKEVLAEIEHRHLAHVLRSELREGEPCPVCTQTVSRLPPPPLEPAVDEAKAALRRADSALAAARKGFAESGRDLALSEERRRSAQASLAATSEKLASNAAALSELAGDCDPRAELEQARQAFETLRTKAEKASAERQRAAVALKQASTRRDEIAAEVLKMVTVLSGTCGRLGLDPVLISEEGLPQTVKRLKEHGRSRLVELERRAGHLAASLSEARSAVMEFRGRFGAQAGEAPAEVLARAISEVQSQEDRINQLEAALARRREAERQAEQIAGRKALYERLAADLTDSKFTAYLLTEQTRLLCELASEKFHELSGYYTFDFDAQGNITVVDERTGSVRSPQDTLSGGESFLASLSLALALAETVANRGGRLECFFLDEGFGSLDAEALDRALEGIQILAEPGRMIGLISHVGGIQSQLEDLIVLERNRDGSTSVVQEGGPIAYLPAAI